MDSQQYYQGIWDASPTGILIIDARTHEVLDANTAAAEDIGAVREEIVGQICRMRMRATQADAGSGNGIAGAADDQECASVHADKWQVFILEAMAHAKLNGRDCLIVECLSDTGEQKHAQEDVRQAHAEVSQLFSAIPSILIALSPDNKITRWNTVAERTLGVPGSEALGKALEDCGVSWEWASIAMGLRKCQQNHRPVSLADVRYTRVDGKEAFLGLTLNPFGGADQTGGGVLIIGADITERKILQSQLAQAQKLESIGQLAAGIAHEINTPTQYVGDNTRFLADSFGDILGLLKQYESLAASAADGSGLDLNRLAEVRAEAEKADIEYLCEEIPEAIRQSLEGIERVTKIVRAMKDYSHPNSEDKTPVDINKEIQTTITVARNEWKYVADMKTEFDESLPPVECLPGEMNQVILNMITNAAHAIEDVVGDGSESKGTITISTRLCDDEVEICVSDTGAGISDEIKEKIFDPFFTTKEVGKGTGQGLTISRSVIVDKHGGKLDCQSEVGKGTKFIMRIPIEAVRPGRDSRAA